jgi:hypothetical protein
MIRGTGSSGHDPVAVAQQLLQAGFPEAAATAAREADRRLAERTEQLRTQLTRDAQRLADELDRWRGAELAEAEHRLSDHVGDGFFQLGLFTDLGHSTFRTLDEAHTAINTEFDRRRQSLSEVYQVADVGAVEPVGCILLVEAR